MIKQRKILPHLLILIKPCENEAFGDRIQVPYIHQHDHLVETLIFKYSQLRSHSIHQITTRNSRLIKSNLNNRIEKWKIIEIIKMLSNSKHLEKG